MEFNVGDIVELNSGSPPLTVIGEANSPVEGHFVIVEWEDEGESTQAMFLCSSVHRIFSIKDSPI